MDYFVFWVFFFSLNEFEYKAKQMSNGYNQVTIEKIKGKTRSLFIEKYNKVWGRG